MLNLRLLRHFECIIDFDAQVSHGAFQLCMAEQQLNRSQVLGSLINQRGFCPAHRVGPVGRGIQARSRHPVMHDPGVLLSRDMWGTSNAAGKELLLRFEIGLCQPSGHGRPSRFSQFELHRPLRFALDDHRPR